MDTQNEEKALPNAGEEHVTSDDVPVDDTHKTEKLTKAGREDLDPDEGSD